MYLSQQINLHNKFQWTHLSDIPNTSLIQLDQKLVRKILENLRLLKTCIILRDKGKGKLIYCSCKFRTILKPKSNVGKTVGGNGSGIKLHKI